MNNLRHIIITLATAMTLIPLQAQVRQQGEVVLQNSGRQPLAGVQVRAMGATPATSDAAGRFDLHFSKSRPGQLLLLDDVYKDGYELVNEEALKQWTVSRSSILPIVMCRKGALAAAQEKYYEIGRSHNMARYAEACRQLDEQLAQNLLTEQQYNARLDKLSADYIKAMEHLEAYAYALACYNRDDLNQMAGNALALVEKDAAIYYGVNWPDFRDAFYTTMYQELPCDLAQLSHHLLFTGFHILKIASPACFMSTVIAEK